MNQGELLTNLMLIRSTFTAGLKSDTLTQAIQIIDKLTKDCADWKAIAWEAVRDLQQLRDEPECGWTNEIDKHIQDCYAKENGNAD